MNTYQFARYLITQLEMDLGALKALREKKEPISIGVSIGMVTVRKETLNKASQCWSKFPTSLQIEARRLIRIAETALNE